MGIAREPVHAERVEGSTVEVRVGHHLDDPADQVVAERPDPGGVLDLVLDRQLDRRGEAGDRRRVDGPAADVALLAATVDQRRDDDLTTDDEGARAVGAAELVAR